MLNFDAFQASLSAETPPAALTAPLRALWLVGQDAQGDAQVDAMGDAWDRAHKQVQDEDGADAAWVHAHLHRIEGDAGNAAYWYRRAGRPICKEALHDEWRAIVTGLLSL